MAKKMKAQEVLQSPQVSSLQSILVMGAALLIIVIALRYIAMDLIAPILLALFFTILLMPFFQWFRKRGFSRGVSLALMLGTMFISLLAFIWFFQWSLSLLSASLEVSLSTLRASIETTSQNLGIDTSTTSILTQSLSPETVSSLLSTIASGVGSLLFLFVIIPILSILILLQVDAIPEEVTKEMIAQRPMLAKLTRFAQSVIVYVTARFKVNLLTGIVFAFALYLLGIDFAIVWGILAVFLSFIPYIGLIVAAFPPVLLGFVNGGFLYAVLVGVVLIVLNLLIENMLIPLSKAKRAN